MKTAYENQLLGAFIYALGYESGLLRTRGMAINLFQQTPLDSAYGDLVVGAERCIAFEFKRSRSTISDERDKWSREALVKFQTDKLLSGVSSRAHVLCYGESDPDGVAIQCLAYHAALTLGDGAITTSFPAIKLIRALIASVTNPEKSKVFGVKPHQLDEYLRRLAQYRRMSGGSVKTDGAWVAIAKKTGGYAFLTASSLENLIDRDLGLGRNIQPKRELDHDRNEPEIG